MSRAAFASAMAIACASNACILHTDSTRNAPGNVRLHDPPHSIYSAPPDAPPSSGASDPGERVVLFPVNATVGINKHYTTLGGETALVWGTRDTKHTEPLQLLSVIDAMLVRPKIGMSFVSIDDNNHATVGPIYLLAELERYVPSAASPFWGFSTAIGPTWDPARHDAGGQLDVCTSSAIMYLFSAFCFRGAYYVSRGFDPQVVITLRGFLGWTESR